MVDCKRTQYGLYQQAVQLVKSLDENLWKKAVLWVFDTPDNPNRSYEVKIIFQEFSQIFPGKNRFFKK